MNKRPPAVKQRMLQVSWKIGTIKKIKFWPLNDAHQSNDYSYTTVKTNPLAFRFFFFFLSFSKKSFTLLSKTNLQLWQDGQVLYTLQKSEQNLLNNDPTHYIQKNHTLQPLQCCCYPDSMLWQNMVEFRLLKSCDPKYGLIHSHILLLLRHILNMAQIRSNGINQMN